MSKFLDRIKQDNIRAVAAFRLKALNYLTYEALERERLDEESRKLEIELEKHAKLA